MYIKKLIQKSRVCHNHKPQLTLDTNKCIHPQVRGRQPQGTKFWCQQKPTVTSVICYKFKKNLFEVWFYTNFCMILYMYIATGQGLTTPWGWNFDVNRNILSLQSFFFSSFENISLKSDFYAIYFHDFIHVYSPGAGVGAGAGADSPQGTKFWCQRKCLCHFIHLL